MLSTIPSTTITSLLHINQVYLICTVASEAELGKAFASKIFDKIGPKLLFPKKSSTVLLPQTKHNSAVPE